MSVPRHFVSGFFQEATEETETEPYEVIPQFSLFAPVKISVSRRSGEIRQRLIQLRLSIRKGIALHKLFELFPAFVGE